MTAMVLLVCWFGDGAGDAASAQVGEVGSGAGGLSARTLSGRVRGRPAPMRGMLMPSRTARNWGESPRCGHEVSGVQ
jgi:hypothetical protein